MGIVEHNPIYDRLSMHVYFRKPNNKVAIVGKVAALSVLLFEARALCASSVKENLHFRIE